VLARQAIKRIADELLRAGVRRSGVLLVHSSLSSLGRVPGGPETVVRGLLEALGPDGTLLLPALSYMLVTPERPVFDVLKTPANVGAIPEHFRTRRGTRRSLHPTHSVCAVGPLAEELLTDHELDSTPCGPHSPFHRLPHYDGQILMLGCGLRPNTSMHALEELVGPPYLFGQELVYRLTLTDRSTTAKIYRPHGFDGWRQRYDRVESLLEGDALKRGKVLKAEVHLIEAKALWEVAAEALRRDPLHFVERAG
jgi:aminoglycoside 3-N-acetyltransferase